MLVGLVASAALALTACGGGASGAKGESAGPGAKAAQGGTLQVLANDDPDLAVARGAVAYGQSLRGHGTRIESNAARGYYVGLDVASAMHPQTLLAWALNGEPLTWNHGAPLRLAIPIKYGVKNIKRIATIRWTNVRPTDYWGERGYDWYCGH